MISLTKAQEQKLKQALLGDEKLGATELRIINTDVYKERLGSEWFKYKAIIEAYAAQAIKANLGEGDLFFPTRHGFAVFFFSESEEKVAAASAQMARELTRLLAREQVFQDPPVSCGVRPLSRSDLVKEIDFDLGSQRAAPRPIAEPMLQRTERSPSRPSNLKGAGYRPLWHAKMQRVVGCIAEPEGSLTMVSEQRYYDTGIQHVRYDLDRFNAILADVYKLYKNNETAAVMFSINFKCFCAPEFNKEYMLALRQTPANLMPYLLPRFVRIPPGAPNTLIATKAQALASIFKRLALQTPLEGNLHRFEFTACTLLVTSVKEAQRVVRSASTGLQSVGQLLTSFVQLAKAMRYNALITGVDTPESLDVAMQAKADFISGEMIGPLSQLPGSQFRLTTDEIRAASGALDASSPALAAPTSLPPQPPSDVFAI